MSDEKKDRVIGHAGFDKVKDPAETPDTHEPVKKSTDDLNKLDSESDKTADSKVKSKHDAAAEGKKYVDTPLGIQVLIDGPNVSPYRATPDQMETLNSILKLTSSDTQMHKKALTSISILFNL